MAYESTASELRNSIEQFQVIAEVRRQDRRNLQSRIAKASVELLNAKSTNVRVHANCMGASCHAVNGSVKFCSDELKNAACTSGPMPCAIFETHEPSVRHFKKTVRLSSAGIRTGESVLAHVLKCRNDAVRTLGCSEKDICWLYESERHPELTQNGAITSHLGSPGVQTPQSRFFRNLQLD